MDKIELINYLVNTAEQDYNTMDSFIDKEIIEKIARRYAEMVNKEITISQAYLYGSFAKGTNNEDSDIDIAIVAEGFTGDNIEDTFKLMKIRRKIDNRIEPHPFNNSEFNMSNPFF